MTAYFKGKPKTQTDMLLINGKEYTEKELKEIIKKHEDSKDK